MIGYEAQQRIRDELPEWEYRSLSDADMRYEGTLHRYLFYRRRFSPTVACAYALTWSENMIGQRARRISHDTGATR